MKKITLTAAFLFVIGFTAAWAGEESYASKIQTLTALTDSSLNVHNIRSSQLPSSLLKDLKKEYKDYWISELYEEGQDMHFTYYITIENADQVVKLNTIGSKNNWTVASTVLKPL